MAAAKKLPPITQAYERCKIARDALRDMDAQCMETVQEKCGLLIERYIVRSEIGAVAGPVKATNVVLYATPDWWELFTPMTDDMTNDGTIAALRAMQK